MIINIEVTSHYKEEKQGSGYVTILLQVVPTLHTVHLTYFLTIIWWVIFRASRRINWGYVRCDVRDWDSNLRSLV